MNADHRRLPIIPPAEYNAEQRDAAAEFLKARTYPVFGPFEPMMHSPTTMSLARAMGDHYRYKSAVGTSLSELAILMTARAWSQAYEWSVHYPAALKAGIRQSVADAIARRVVPAELSTDESMIYDFVSELLAHRQVSDGAFERVRQRFGEAGVVDLTGIVGYYTFLAMQLNVARYPAPADAARLPD